MKMEALSDVGFENSLWFLIQFSSTEVLFVGVVYRAPNMGQLTMKNVRKVL